MHKILFTLIVITSTMASAHDSPMQGLKNAKGELCCGAGDCVAVEPVRTTSNGFLIEANKELVPFAEAQPSPDGQFWRCHKPDGSRRCFFAPPPST